MDPIILYIMFISVAAYKYIAIFGSAFFVLQLVFAITGICPFKISPAIDGDFSISRHRFKMLLFRSLTSFFMGFGWAGFLFRNSVGSEIMLASIAFVFALMLAVALYPLLKVSCRIGEKNAFILEEALEKIGEVYIQIPGNDKGMGKILINNEGVIREHVAITFDDKPIDKGKMITIVGIENSVLIVTLL